jgi:photosynthetic reaction center cytochrome c subunit
MQAGMKIASLVFVFLLLSITASTQTSPPAPKASSVYKNLRMLQDLPAAEIVPSMQFIAGSLGVGCSYCHVEGAFEKDDKKPKQTARKMMEMVRGINANSFAGEREVTCYTCHRGAAKVITIPPVGPRVASSEAEPPAASVPVEQILQRYLQALGGAQALQKVTTRVEKGTATIGGRQFAIEVFAQAPNNRTVVLHLPNGDSTTTFDGEKGWVTDPGREARAMTAGEKDAAGLDGALQFPRALGQLGFELRATAPEKVNDAVTDVVSVRVRDKSIGKLYFEQQSGLLVRAVRYANTPLGENPTQVDYADYREQGGVKVPYQWTISRPGGSYTVKLDSVQLNASVDPASFRMPEPNNKTAAPAHDQ